MHVLPASPAMVQGYCRCQWKDHCFQHNVDFWPCWNALWSGYMTAAATIAAKPEAAPTAAAQPLPVDAPAPVPQILYAPIFWPHGHVPRTPPTIEMVIAPPADGQAPTIPMTPPPMFRPHGQVPRTPPTMEMVIVPPADGQWRWTSPIDNGDGQVPPADGHTSTDNGDGQVPTTPMIPPAADMWRRLGPSPPSTTDVETTTSMKKEQKEGNEKEDQAGRVSTNRSSRSSSHNRRRDRRPHEEEGSEEGPREDTNIEGTKADREVEALLSASCNCLVAQGVSPSPVVALLLVMIGLKATRCQNKSNKDNNYFASSYPHLEQHHCVGLPYASLSLKLHTSLNIIDTLDWCCRQ